MSFLEVCRRKAKLYMSLYRFLKPLNRFPEPKRSLSASIPTPAIRQANKEVEVVLKENTGEHGRKRKSYKKISDELIAKVGKYAAELGNTAAVRKFSQEFESPLRESTVRSLKKAYLMELRRKREASILESDDEELGVNSKEER